MTSEENNSIIPARITQEQCARILGFQVHDIPVLVANKLLTPLGKPAPNSIKYFAKIAILKHAQDEVWLNKATKVLSQHWKAKNERKAKRTTEADQFKNSESSALAQCT